jgi:hypothetical protein
MRRLGRDRRGRGKQVVLALLVVTAGCREELGPEPMPTTRVRGVVREGRRPVGGGWIEFVPVEGTVGNLRSAPLKPNGSFEADRVAIGRNVIGLAHAPTALPSSRIFETFTSPIRREIPGGSVTTLDLDLIEEAFRRPISRSR